jgi:hypothetical protein
MLRLEATDEEFSTFLRETCGIETNTAAKGHTDLWKDRGSAQPTLTAVAAAYGPATC